MSGLWARDWPNEPLLSFFVKELFKKVLTQFLTAGIVSSVAEKETQTSWKTFIVDKKLTQC